MPKTEALINYLGTTVRTVRRILFMHTERVLVIWVPGVTVKKIAEKIENATGHISIELKMGT
jgi:hypothetical protein